MRASTGLVLALPVVFVLALAPAVGSVEAISLVGATGLIAASAWLPIRAVRYVASFLLGGLLFALTRAHLTSVGALLVAVVAGLMTAQKASPAVLRRIMFMIPSLGLLIFATTLLMYHAPGNPFASERVVSPQVEAALRAQYGVPESALEFFQIYMKRLLVDGSLGPSIKVQGRP